jgi:hypothetical protein
MAWLLIVNICRPSELVHTLLSHQLELFLLLDSPVPSPTQDSPVPFLTSHHIMTQEVMMSTQFAGSPGDGQGGSTEGAVQSVRGVPDGELLCRMPSVQKDSDARQALHCTHVHIPAFEGCCG